MLSTSPVPIRRSHTKRTCRILSTGTIPTSASCAGVCRVVPERPGQRDPDDQWESDHPRVLWDGGAKIDGSSCVSCGHCVTVCPCNALMEKSMLGEAGYLTDTPTAALDNMIDVVKGIEPPIGYGPILALSEMEAEMRNQANQAHQDRLHLLRGRLQLRGVDKGSPHPQDRANRTVRPTAFRPA